ncbi:glutathione-disulfide reductase [Candidatus Endobugula sertula]|uniref:Glutathione reductase n=1 Tax=Candidatus Endobugula sertula TaxID=62101 RepID=A0A1D2QL86_9GAMM|nr:glutathione-disulfide reductase [Candidatus Endobugula sertula]
MFYDYDLFVIGAGSGGVRASRIAAGLGAKVAVAEDLFLGGTCVNVGCVPKKLLVYGSHFSEEFEAAAGFGWTIGSSSFHWPTLRDNKTKEIERLNGVYQNLLESAGVDIINGRATIIDPHTIAVGDRQFTAERILVAVGGWPAIPDIPGREHIISSNEVFYLEEFPKRVAVVGGGYIAVEFAGIFQGLGSDTHLLYRGDLFLRGFDRDVREFTASEMIKKGVNLHFNRSVSAIEKQVDGSLLVRLTDGSTLEVDTIMYATGRKPKIEHLGLENTAVKLTHKGSIQVNDNFQTAEPSIYAVGDVIDRMQLTPVALAEGMALAQHLYSDTVDYKVDYGFVATAVFCQPNIGTVGYSEERAKEKFDTVAVYKSNFKPMKHTLSDLDERTFVKLLVDQNTDRVIGCHMVGADAGEIIQGLAIAIKAGATKADFDSTIGIHSTVAEEFVTMREPAYIL